MTALLVSAVLTGMLGLLVSAVLVGMPASAARLAIRVVWAAQAVLPESQVLGEPEALLGWFFRVLEVELETAITVGHNISLKRYANGRQVPAEITNCSAQSVM